MIRSMTVLLVGLTLPSVGRAHDLRPSFLVLHERDDGAFEVRWTPSPTDLSAGVFLEVQWPPGCSATDVLACRDGLRGAIGVPAVAASAAEVVVRVRWRDGREATGVIVPGAPEWELPEGATPPSVPRAPPWWAWLPVPLLTVRDRGGAGGWPVGVTFGAALGLGVVAVGWAPIAAGFAALVLAFSAVWRAPTGWAVAVAGAWFGLAAAPSLAWAIPWVAVHGLVAWLVPTWVARAGAAPRVVAGALATAGTLIAAGAWS